VENSVVAGLFAADGRQVGFARAVTDRATFAWIADVFVLESERGNGLGRFVVETLLAHPDLQGLRRLMLATADAHDLYRSYGFADLSDPSRYLVRQIAPEILYD
jgi:GNAT superfamily N-acetyltransferase